MSSKTKRILALLCAVVLVATTFFGNTYMKQGEVKAADSVEPISLDGFENVTISDFVDADGNAMPEGYYDGNSNGAHNDYSVHGLANFNKVLLSMKVKFDLGTYANALFVGSAGGWRTLTLHPNADGTTLEFAQEHANPKVTNSTLPSMEASKTSVSNFIGDEFLLQLSFEYGDFDGDSAEDLKLGVYIEGQLYNNSLFTISGCDTACKGSYLGLYRQTDGKGITVNSVEWPAEPVVLDGYTNLTLNDFVDSSSNMFADGEYVQGTAAVYHAVNVSNFDNVLLSMKIKFNTDNYQTSMTFGGNGEWCGMNLHPASNGEQLVLDTSWAGSYASYTPITMYASTAEVDSFLDNEFLLQISFDYTDLTASTTDLTIGFYIEGKLYDNQTYVISNCQVANVANYLSLYREASGQSISVKSVELGKEPVVVDGFDNITIADFTKSDGTTLSAGTYMGEMSSSLKEETNFNNKLLSMYVTYTGGGTYNNSITIAGKDMYHSFALRPNDEGTELQFVTGDWGSDIATGVSFIITAEEAGVSSFVNNEFLLQISFLYGAETNGTADLTLGIYVDGKDCGTKTFTGCNMAYTGTSLCTVIYDPTNKNITLGNVKFPEFAGYTEVTVEDFVDASGNVMESKAYQCTDPINGITDDFALADGTSFHKKLISMNVQFNHDGTNTWNTRIDVGRDNEGAWEGFSLYTNETGSELKLKDMYGTCEKDSLGNSVEQSMSASTAGISSFLKNKFLLQMTFDIGDFDGQSDTDDIQIGVYINGTLYNDEKFIFYDCTAYGNHIGLYRQADYSTIIVGSVNEEFPADPGIQPSARYEKLTFGHFGIANQTYPHISGQFAASGTANGRDTLDKTVICGDIKMVGDKQFYIVFGGQSDWAGLFMFATPDTIQLKWNNIEGSVVSSDGGSGTLYANQAFEKSFVGDEYNIMLSTELVNHNGDDTAAADDIKIGIWFDGVLYNQQYFYVDDKGTELGKYFSVYCGNDANEETDSVTFGSEMDLLEQPDAELERVSFTEFGFENGTYNSADLKIGTYLYGDTVDGIVLCGKVKFNDNDTAVDELGLVIGGTEDDIWTTGIRLTMWQWSSGKLVLYAAGDTRKTFDINKTGVDYFNEEVDLMWSVQLVDHAGDGNVNDLKVGVWFNGFLYENSYIYVDEFGTTLGNALAPYATNNSNVVLNYSKQYSKVPNEDFDTISFSDFGYESGIYKQADGMPEKQATSHDKFDKVVFSGDLRLSDSGLYHIIYGGKSGWNGLRLIIDPNGTGSLGWFHNFGDGDQIQGSIGFQPTDVGLNSFTKETFNLKISTELVDNDGDGNKNDIKVGVWFNDMLFKNNGNEYTIISDWGDLLGNYLSIYFGTEGTNALFRNVDSYQKNPYYYEAEDVTSYRESGTYPKEPGYVFAGWYKDAEYTEWINKDEIGTSAWAKFLEDDVLSVQSQVKVTTTDADGDGKLDVTSNSTDLRVATTVDGLEYRRISFYLQKQQADGTYGNKFNTATVSDENARMVYEKLYALEDKTTVTEHKPTIFSWQSDYFKTFTITDIPSSDYGTKIKVTPYWITMDGTLVEGKAVETSVNDYTNNKSQSVSVGYIGNDTLPITGFNGPYVVSNANDAMLYPDYITDEYFKLIADSGVNVIVCSNLDYAQYPVQVKKALELGEKYGIGLYVQDSTILTMTTKADVEAQIANYSGYESFIGMYLVDEPGTEDYKSGDRDVSNYKTIAGILNELKILTYVNMYPIVETTDFWDWIGGTDDEKNYSNYVSEVNTTLNPSVLMWDYYPFAVKRNDDGTRASEVTTTHPEYFWNMGEIRSQAQAAGKPFWAYVQAGANWNDQQDYFTTNIYAPTEGQFKWNMNTALAFGAQGIQYFPLIQPYHFAYAGSSAEDKIWDFERNGLIGAFGNPTQWYDYAQEANAHVGAMDHILMNSYNEKIIAIGSAKNDTSDVDGVTTTVSYNELTGATGNALIGCFDYKGKTALYVVNYDYDNAGTVTLTFNGSQSITKIENAVTSETSGSSLTLNMDAGEGILLVIE